MGKYEKKTVCRDNEINFLRIEKNIHNKTHNIKTYKISSELTLRTESTRDNIKNIIFL